MPLDLFKEILPSIMQTKTNVLVDEQSEKDYNAYMVNKALSFHKDCIFFANEMNRLYDVPKKLQYDYFLNKIRSVKRPFVPWSKASKEQHLDAVKKYFGYSGDRAREALKILTDEQIAEITEKTTVRD